MYDIIREYYLEEFNAGSNTFVPYELLCNDLYPGTIAGFDGELMEDGIEYLDPTTADGRDYVEYSDDPWDIVEREELEDMVNNLVRHLSDREESIIRGRFGMIDDKSDRTLEEISQLFGITREKVRQIECSAIHKLKHPKFGSGLHKELKCYVNDWDPNDIFRPNILDWDKDDYTIANKVNVPDHDDKHTLVITKTAEQAREETRLINVINVTGYSLLNDFGNRIDPFTFLNRTAVSDYTMITSLDVISKIMNCGIPTSAQVCDDKVLFYHQLSNGEMVWGTVGKEVLIEAIQDKWKILTRLYQESI